MSDGADVTTQEYPEIDGRQFRNVLGQFCTGITVITTFDGAGDEKAPVGFACQSFAALSLDPPLVLFCPTKGSRSWAAIERNGRFCANVLAEEQQQLCARFGSREPDKFAETAWRTSDLELPLLDDALATIQCSVDRVVDGGDHHIVIGRVLALSESTTSGRPLLFYRGQYTAIEPEKTVPAPWRADLEHFLTTTTLDTWL
ncbi:3-hydroxy-9,10-secoandrosta-1,3,5(10)-triene-9,17-dione monooxygenase reductase subunit [Nocardia cyriacigeorgica]|uniref:3-hydroxy-9,10-secoandrosta-1,3,5(10)-triene-9, 17-dione monooxygenase reductase subunit n=1 Tax=Nocardia cyriacigeorgica TaxID=135487 RepID=UPI0002DEF927|nr:3-hydroxy-9,10-secoandrosta-1,3,5(10)-triene-9,17-dione monooxygenase reductase subunit [Nocardia cyriacigeorgica]MBF6087423.1 flavin reductase family protein [Nocardia cyriacigeorgica]MBF6092647.1 flavin reductase family protein [Nocardia cyriacigeorgica]PPJ03922.1 flavin reductase [Nocardia cyriacigeorgica]TLF58416.1 flavin reductase family protein [Nocardia cyriacigeorgica]